MRRAEGILKQFRDKNVKKITRRVPTNYAECEMSKDTQDTPWKKEESEGDRERDKVKTPTQPPTDKDIDKD